MSILEVRESRDAAVAGPGRAGGRGLSPPGGKTVLRLSVRFRPNDSEGSRGALRTPVSPDGSESESGDGELFNGTPFPADQGASSKASGERLSLVRREPSASLEGKDLRRLTSPPVPGEGTQTPGAKTGAPAGKAAFSKRALCALCALCAL